MIDLVAHLLAFAVGTVVFLSAPLLIGYLVRPSKPGAEKASIYECGEETIGSSNVQFDLRFYVIALLFVVFEVEVVFFFPWAVIFGTTMQLADTRLSDESRIALSEHLLSEPAGSLDLERSISAASALQLGWLGFADLAVFFGVLLLGFAYLWKRGDLEWVRSANPERNLHSESLAKPYPSTVALGESI